MKYDEIKSEILNIETQIEETNVLVRKKQRELQSKSRDIDTLKLRLNDEIDLSKSKALKSAETDMKETVKIEVI